jgi:hypothetical protein
MGRSLVASEFGVHTEPLFNALFVVIFSTTSFAPFQQPLQHYLFRRREKEDHACWTHIIVEFERLIHFPWEPVNQEPSFTVRPGVSIVGLARFLLESGLHRVLKQFDGNFHGDDFAFLDAGLNHVLELRALTMLFGAKEITGWNGTWLL